MKGEGDVRITNKSCKIEFETNIWKWSSTLEEIKKIVRRRRLREWKEKNEAKDETLQNVRKRVKREVRMVTLFPTEKNSF